MPRHRNFECWIQCGNERLQEFSSSLDGKDNTVCCWIPSVAGMNFAVHYRNICCTIDFQCTVCVDGIRMRSLVRRAEYTQEEVCDGARVDRKTLRPFVFSSIDLTDDESLATFKPNSMFGTIEIIFRLVVREGSIPWTAAGELEFQDGPMLERDKRVGALRVVLGDSVESFAKDQIRVRSFDPCNPGPHAIFRFQYRTREFLIAQNIIQIPPTSKNKRLRSSPRPSDVDQHSKRMKPTRKVKEENLPSGSNSPPVRGDSDDVADAALEAEIRTRQQMLENLRKERQIQEEILNLQKQRRERPLKTVTVRYLEGGVIDLTGD